MRRKISFFLIAFLCLHKTYSQLYDSTGYYSQLNYIFVSLDKTQIGSIDKDFDGIGRNETIQA